jgi:DMSO/TMAO reductase YedYZ molybdopterin-dependent catalytic subunit
MTGRRDALRASWSGVAAAALGVGAGELLAALLSPTSSPVASVGSAVINRVPGWLKDWAISVFGTSDKLALVVSVGIVLAVLAAVAGLAESRRPPLGSIALGLLAVLGALAALTRADAGSLSVLPAAVAGLVSVLALRCLLRLLAPSPVAVVTGRREAGSDVGPREAGSDVGLKEAGSDVGPRMAVTGYSRRRFLLASLSMAAVGAVAATLATLSSAATRSVEAVRAALRLPRAAAPASVPPEAELGIDGLAPVVTPNEDFYRIDTAIVVPHIDPADWSLRIHGLVEREVTLTWDELLALELEESVTTLSCVSNQVGGDLVSTATWLGYPIRELLAQAGPLEGADMVLSTSQDGFTAGTPLEALTDEREAILAVGMNGEPLPFEHGFPVRMVVPGLYGYVSATKWVVDFEVTRFDQARAYWTDRGWDERGPIKLQSRIDVPRSGDVAAGRSVVAGVAWQPHTGIDGVEVRVDTGEWLAADLARAINADTWVQWSVPVDLPAGEHTIQCRATSAGGELQTAELAPPAPNGASGWHVVRVRAS